MTWWHGFSLFVQNHRTKPKQPKSFRHMHVSMYCYFRWFFSRTECYESQNHWFGQHLISATMWPLEGKNSAHTTLPLNALRFQCASPFVVTLGDALNDAIYPHSFDSWFELEKPDCGFCTPVCETNPNPALLCCKHASQPFTGSERTVIVQKESHRHFRNGTLIRICSEMNFSSCLKVK